MSPNQHMSPLRCDEKTVPRSTQTDDLFTNTTQSNILVYIWIADSHRERTFTPKGNN